MKVKAFRFLHIILGFSTIVISTIVISPTVCRADAINPLTNLFTRDTIIPASVLTILIIVIEAILLRRLIKPTLRFRLHLVRSTLINLISSAAGSIIVLLFYHGPIWVLSDFLFVPMFFLTLATETPVLRVLYRHNGINWMRAIKISVVINLISYTFVFLTQFLFFFILFLFSAFPIRGEPVKIDGYMGDGTITKIGSSTFPGFEIEFTRFNISKHHRERYKLEGLPKGRVDNSYYISLRAYEKYELDIAKTDIAKMGFLDGKINLKITDDKGEILFEKRSKISDLIRTSRDGKANDFYYMDKETFSGFKSTALDSQPLHVEFEYVPALSKNKKINISAGLILTFGGYK